MRCVIWGVGGNCEVIYSYSKQKETINIKSKKTEIYQEKQTLVASKYPPTEIRIDHRNKTSIDTLNIYLFLC
jgi:hypothetical protein